MQKGKNSGDGNPCLSLNEVDAWLKYGSVATKFVKEVSTNSFHIVWSRQFHHTYRPKEAGERTATVNIRQEIHVCREQFGRTHVDDIHCTKVRLSATACAFSHNQVIMVA